MRTEALYVAAGANGLVKVGRTSNPKSRKGLLSRDFKLMGDVLSSFEVTGFVGYYASSEEKQLIDFAKALKGSLQVHGREYFKGICAIKCFEKAQEIAEISLAKIRLEQEREAKVIADQKKFRQAKIEAQKNKLEDLKRKHFAEFINLQEQGLLPIPQVKNE